VGGFAGAAQLVDYILKLLSQENGYDGRRRLVGSQSVVISHIGGRLPEKVCMDIHCLDDTCQYQKELDVFMRRVTRIQEIGAVIRGQRPVVMLTRTIDARKGLLMKEAGHAVASGHLLKCLHDNLVVVNSLVYTLVDRRKLMLGRSHLVVLCLGRHA